MRSLKLSLLLMLLISFVCQAEAPAFNVASSFFTSKGQALVTTAQQANNLSSQTLEFSASTGLVSNRYRLRMKSGHVKRDVSNYFYINRLGETVSLKETFNGEESVFGGGGDFSFGSLTLSLDGQKTVTDSPIAATTIVSKIQYSSYDRGIDVGIEFQDQSLDRPESFFRNAETNEIGSVPGNLHRQEIRLLYSQLLSENLRFSAFGLGAKRIEEGRESIGAGAKGMYALSDLFSLIGGVERRQDLKKSLPEDNRGYFDLTSFEAGFGFELINNLLVKFLAGTTVEHEAARGTSPRQTVGTDGFAAGLDYNKARFSAKLFSRIEQSNTGYKSFQITGGLSWDI